MGIHAPFNIRGRVWDRGALVALRPEDREDYVRVCDSVLAPGGRILLATMVYEQSAKKGADELFILFENPVAWTNVELRKSDFNALFAKPFLEDTPVSTAGAFPEPSDQVVGRSRQGRGSLGLASVQP